MDNLSTLLEQAILIATKAHGGQCDKIGVPYILHPLAVMYAVNTLEEKIVAILHDVVEDTAVTLQELSETFPLDIIEAIRCLTKPPQETYKAYLERVKTNPLAMTVKIADLQHNLRPERCAEVIKPEQQEKYRKALQELKVLKYGYDFSDDEEDEGGYKCAICGLPGGH